MGNEYDGKPCPNGQESTDQESYPFDVSRLVPVAESIRLNCPMFISPFLLRSLPYTGTVEHSSRFIIAGQVLTSETPLRIGQQVRVIAGRRHIELYYTADLNARREYEHQQR